MKLLKKLGIMGLVLGLTVGSVGCSSSSTDENEDTTASEEVVLNISAAASLQEAMVELEQKFKEIDPSVKLEVNLGSSGSLQQQIEQGAACDVFISAGEKQMKDLDEQGLLLEGTNKTLLTNDLVLVTTKGAKFENIEGIVVDHVEHIAIGDPESVPAGKYAKEVLDNTNLYSKVENKLVLAKDVKEVLAWVQQGNADLGFVYLSDAVSAENIEVALTIDAHTHSPINYPIAVLKASKNQDKAKSFEDFLLSKEGQEILEKYGFKKAN